MDNYYQVIDFIKRKYPYAVDISVSPKPDDQQISGYSDESYNPKKGYWE